MERIVNYFKAQKSYGFVERLDNKIKIFKCGYYRARSVVSYFQILWLDLKSYAKYLL